MGGNWEANLFRWKLEEGCSNKLGSNLKGTGERGTWTNLCGGSDCEVERNLEGTRRKLVRIFDFMLERNLRGTGTKPVRKK